MKLNNSWGRIFALATAGGFLLFDGCALKMGKQPRQEIVPLYSTHSAEFRQAAGSLLGPNFIPGNNITTLVNGNQIFPAMLGAIQSAKCSINFETYTFWDGEIARRFTEALAERAQAGVKVNAILDAQGTQKMAGKIWSDYATLEWRLRNIIQVSGPIHVDTTTALTVSY